MDEFDIHGMNIYNGTYKNSNGGTELVYREIQKRMPSELFDKIQLINSRPHTLLNKPRILLQHDHSSDPPKEFSSQKFRKQFDKHVFVSYIQQLLFHEKTGMKYSESTVIRNAINPIEKHEKPDPKECVNIIYHTTPHRGLELLVPAFIEIASRTTQKLHLKVFSSFDAYGQGRRDEQYKKLFQLCEDHPDITYSGFVPNDVIREELKKAHIFAYPNIWPETSAISAIEALAAGCLVICPRHEALIETVGDFGITYSYTEDMQEHINKFASLLNEAIQILPEGKLKGLTEKARAHYNSYYS